MRWNELRIQPDPPRGPESPGSPGPPAGPEARGPPGRPRGGTRIVRARRHHQVVRHAGVPRRDVLRGARAKSVINRVPESSRVPFRWTINPYRGCRHGCVYCFARKTHTYLDLDAGHDFDSKIVVKVNAPELLRRELSSPQVAGRAHRDGHQRRLYQRAEGRTG